MLVDEEVAVALALALVLVLTKDACEDTACSKVVRGTSKAPPLLVNIALLNRKLELMLTSGYCPDTIDCDKVWAILSNKDDDWREAFLLLRSPPLATAVVMESNA